LKTVTASTSREPLEEDSRAEQSDRVINLNSEDSL